MRWAEKTVLCCGTLGVPPDQEGLPSQVSDDILGHLLHTQIRQDSVGKWQDSMKLVLGNRHLLVSHFISGGRFCLRWDWIGLRHVINQGLLSPSFYNFVLKELLLCGGSWQL